MLLRYFCFMFVIFGCLWACKNGETNTDEQTNSTTGEVMKAGDQKAVNSSNIKSFQEAAREQGKLALAKKEKLDEEGEKSMSEALLRKQKAMKVEGKKNADLIKKNKIEVKKKSRKSQIIQNLKKSNINGRDAREFGPSKDFQMGTRSLFDVDLKIVELKQRPVSGYERIHEADIYDGHYAYVSPNGVWGGPLNAKKGKETEDLMLQDVHVFEAVYKAKEMDGKYRHDVRITEIQFPDKETADASANKVKAISKAIWEYPKHINNFWQDQERFYIVETRAAAFEPTYEIANKVFYMTVTSSE